jgi:signal transduction histidine kinase
MTKPSTAKGFAVILLILLGCFLCNCKENHNATPKIKLAQSQDSIRIWLDQAKVSDISLEDKSYLLQKARESVVKVTNDSLKSQYLKELSYNYFRIRDSINFKKVNSKALQITKRVNDSASLGEVLWDLGAFFNRHKVYDSAYFNYNKAQKIFKQIENKPLTGQLLLSMARAQSAIGDYIGSEITAIKAIEILKPLQEHKRLYNCYNLLADNAKLLNEPEQAITYYNESLTYLKKGQLGELTEQGWKNNIALVYQKQGLHEKAITYFSEVLSFDSIRHKNPRLYGRVLNNIGYSYLKKDQFKQLPNLFIKAQKLLDSINDTGGKSSSILKLAEYYLKKKDSSKALLHLERARKLVVQNGDKKNLLNTLKIFLQVDPQNTAIYTQQYLHLSDSLQLEERRIRNKFTRIQFETDEFIAENQLLERQNLLWIGITAAILLLGLSTFIIVNQRIKNQKLLFQEEQQSTNQEIFNLMLVQSENVEEGKKMEQKRVSEELHDGVLGRMLGARMILLGLNKRMDPESVAERAKAIAIIQDVEGEVRSISHELSHAAYQKIHNFILSIKDLLDTIQGSSKINFDFNYSDELDWDALSGNIKINLYRIIQESIQNSVKHAGCKNIYMNFYADEAILTIHIEDDGKGFVQKKEKKGIGMRNIASRMIKVNGTWDIKSAVGKGTKVTLKLPLISNDNENAPSILQMKHSIWK